MGCGASKDSGNNNSDKLRAEEERRRRREEELENIREEKERRRREEEERRRTEEEERRNEDEETRRRREMEEDERRREEDDLIRRMEEDRREREEEEERRRREEEDRRPAEDDGEDETPFDDDGFRDAEGYSKTPMGLMVKSLDFREVYLDDEAEERPRAPSGGLYVDDAFPLDIAIVEDRSSGLEWKRPMEIVDNPQLFTDGSTRFDIGQGSAGTCWFLSTVANIAENDEMLKQIIPEDAYLIDNPAEYDGVFHARFYRFGKWEDIYIDDCLPIIYGNVLWGAKSATDDREMWVALLEKAFARLYGSYDAIYGGQPGDAYLLLTGGIGERIELDDHQDNKSKLFRRITNAIKSGCQVACVVPDEYDDYKGLVGGHAYSLVGTQTVRGTKLIRVRNPWGRGEWKGDWSDGSPQWESIPNKEEIAPNSVDGEFYVCLDDFMTYFSQTTICSLTPDMDLDGTADSLNHILNIYGEWRDYCSGGFNKLMENPKYCFTITDDGIRDNGKVPLVIQIIQKSEKRKTDNISIRCDIFKVHGDKITPTRRSLAVEIQGKKNNVYSPELQTSFRHWLRPGKYILVPSTVDAGLEKAFLLRLFSCSPLLDVHQLPEDCRMACCENEEMLEVRGKCYNLTWEKTHFGEFQAGRNAGGQVSNAKTYDKNPQFLITVPDRGSEVPLVIHIMQDQVEPQYPVGIRLFKLEPHEKPPMDVKWLYDQYNNSPYHLEESQSKFMISWDVDVRYMLAPGRYVALVHLDQPDTEKEFSIVFKSDNHIQIKGYQHCG